ncbi:hypothetical protein [Candidatus Avelusimicrobium aviculae]
MKKQLAITLVLGIVSVWAPPIQAQAIAAPKQAVSIFLEEPLPWVILG